MNNTRLLISIILITYLLPHNLIGEAPDFKSRISEKDYRYLQTLAENTWQCIEYLGKSPSGLPYDRSDKSHVNTSVSNIGLYMASIVAAEKLKFIKREKAIRLISKILDSVENLPQWEGFIQSWHDVDTLKPIPEDPWVSILDSGHLAAGYIVARQAFPELNRRISKLLDAMNWAELYDAESKKLIGGHNMKTEEPGWQLTWIGSDARSAILIAVGSGKVPVDAWNTLVRDKETKYGMSYYIPGWNGGGLFMQCIDFSFFDERYTEMYKSAAAFAYAQMHHARVIGAPVWGWSASDSPRHGYIGVNCLRDEVVTPHASSLVISIFPEEVINNLKELDRLGARKDITIGNKSYAFGFRDGIDYVTSETTNSYLVLDQGMLFMALANFLTEGYIWNLTSQDPIIKNTHRKIDEFKKASVKDFNRYIEGLYVSKPIIRVNSIFTKKYYREGDNIEQEIVFINDNPKIQREHFSIHWRLINKNTHKVVMNDSKNIVVSGKYNSLITSVKLTMDRANYLLQAVVLDKNKQIVSEDSKEFALLDYINFEGKCFFKTGDNINWKNVDYDDKTWDKIRIPARWEDEGYDHDGYAWYRIHFDMPAGIEKHKELAVQIGGIDDADQIYINGNFIGKTAFPPDFKDGFWNKERFYSVPDKYIYFGKENLIAIRVFDNGGGGGIWLNPIRLGTEDTLHGTKIPYKVPPWKFAKKPAEYGNSISENKIKENSEAKAIPSKGKIIDDFSDPRAWKTVSDNNIPLKLKSGGKNEGIFEYTLDKGIWTSFKKGSGIPAGLNGADISLELKTEGPANNLEFKLIDNDGSVFGWRTDSVRFAEYSKITFSSSELEYLWGGDKTLDVVSFIEITISKTEGGKGKMYIKNLIMHKER
ncbi:MAG: beta galactosidase jelly roll domain-containing protein [Elusimicrobia bacterium]|nr:beta galactosidase jelly roll domain-containing protein [Elusimicrobiota bacterium]